MSKGSRPRPYSVPLDQVHATHETIFGKKPPKERYVPPPIPEFVKEEKKVTWVSSHKDDKE
jgi:hypothetical protein